MTLPTWNLVVMFKSKEMYLAAAITLYSFSWMGYSEPVIQKSMLRWNRDKK